MECKITYIERLRRGAVLAEWVVSIGICGLLVGAIAAFLVYGSRSFISLSNYVDLNAQSRNAVDRMGKEIRQALKVTAYAPDTITLLVGTNQVTYSYLGNQRTLIRQVNAHAPETLLKGCDSARFDIYQRQATNVTLTSGVSGVLSLLPLTIDPVYPTATKENAKVVQLTWNCSRSILGKKANTEAAQFARIVIRKQSK
jgi:hypothetical protein